MNNAVHYSRAQLVHDLYHGFVVILEGRTFIEAAIFKTASYNVREIYGRMSTVAHLGVSQGREQAADFSQDTDRQLPRADLTRAEEQQSEALDRMEHRAMRAPLRQSGAGLNGERKDGKGELSLRHSNVRHRV